jgi:hypothetical protein
VQVGSLGGLTSTSYGKALIIKLTLVAGLVTFGAFNLLWVRPRLALRPASSRAHPGLSRLPVRGLRRAIGAEILLGAAVLLVVAVLTGLAPSREALRQTGTTDLTQRAKAVDLTIALTPSTLLPGPMTYDVLLGNGIPVPDIQRVALRFSCPELGVDETEVVAVGQGNGHFAITGAYTAIAGNWHTRVIVRRAGREDVSATFVLPIGGSAVPTPVTTLYTQTPSGS